LGGNEPGELPALSLVEGVAVGSNDVVKVTPAPAPRIALTREEAAHALGMSLDSFERHVQAEVRLIRRGKLRLVPVSEIQRWAESNAEMTFG